LNIFECIMNSLTVRLMLCVSVKCNGISSDKAAGGVVSPCSMGRGARRVALYFSAASIFLLLLYRVMLPCTQGPSATMVARTVRIYNIIAFEI
jgi:hypothetical protein